MLFSFFCQPHQAPTSDEIVLSTQDETDLANLVKKTEKLFKKYSMAFKDCSINREVQKASGVKVSKSFPLSSLASLESLSLPLVCMQI